MWVVKLQGEGERVVVVEVEVEVEIQVQDKPFGQWLRPHEVAWREVAYR